MNNVTGAADNMNEAWPAVTDGVGMAMTNWNTKMPLMRSVVIHDLATLGKPKMLCADLTCDCPANTYSGSFGWLSSYTLGNNAGASGMVKLTTGMGTTKIDVTVTGLQAGETYPAHLHVNGCHDVVRLREFDKLY